MYPWAGQDRAATASQLAVGKAGRYDLFAHPQDARRAVEHALGMANDSAQMRTKPGEIMGLLCHGHPLLDGNGRTLMTVHAELCRRACIRIAWEEVAKADYLAALTRELERPGRCSTPSWPRMSGVPRPASPRMLSACAPCPVLVLPKVQLRHRRTCP